MMKYTTILVLVAVLAVISVTASKKQAKRHPFQHMQSKYNIKFPQEFDLGDYVFQESYKVTGFTPDPQETYSGYLSIRQNSTSKLFYVLHSAQGGNLSQNVPLIIWLQGGPGCSSMFGNVDEIGPMNINFNPQTNQTTYTPKSGTWADSNHLLFIDQPLGVGFSIQDPNESPVSSTKQAAQDLQTFLIRFFQIYPNLLLNDIYLFGESYAGHYVPATAAVIVKNQTQSGIYLTGIGIGDGIVDPINQIPFWDVYTFSNGLLSTMGRDNMAQNESLAVVDILNQNYASCASRMDDVLGYIGDVNPGINIYNFRQYGGGAPDYLEAWANAPSTQSQLNTPPSLVYQGCNGDVYMNFINDICVSFATDLEYLSGKIKVLVYNGQDDIIINSPGTENYLWNLKWPDGQDITQAQKTSWTLNGDVVGTVQTSGITWFAVVNKAGHMVPADQPDSCRAMLAHFQAGDGGWN